LWLAVSCWFVSSIWENKTVLFYFVLFCYFTDDPKYTTSRSRPMSLRVSRKISIEPYRRVIELTQPRHIWLNRHFKRIFRSAQSASISSSPIAYRAAFGAENHDIWLHRFRFYSCQIYSELNQHILWCRNIHKKIRIWSQSWPTLTTQTTAIDTKQQQQTAESYTYNLTKVARLPLCSSSQRPDRKNGCRTIAFWRVCRRWRTAWSRSDCTSPAKHTRTRTAVHSEEIGVHAAEQGRRTHRSWEGHIPPTFLHRGGQGVHKLMTIIHVFKHVMYFF